MIPILLAGWAATMAAFLLAGHRHDNRVDRLTNIIITERGGSDHRTTQLLAAHAAERAQPHPDIAALIALVENMAQRIQAPQQAVIDHALQTELPPMPNVVMPDDDQGFWESREDLAVRAMSDELATSEADASG
jgi:hypothetical protein